MCGGGGEEERQRGQNLTSNSIALSLWMMITAKARKILYYQVHYVLNHIQHVLSIQYEIEHNSESIATLKVEYAKFEIDIW